MFWVEGSGRFLGGPDGPLGLVGLDGLVGWFFFWVGSRARKGFDCLSRSYLYQASPNEVVVRFGRWRPVG